MHTSSEHLPPSRTSKELRLSGTPSRYLVTPLVSLTGKKRHRLKCQVLNHTVSTLNRAASTCLTVPPPLLSCRCCLCAPRGRERRRQLGMQPPAGDTAALARDAAGAPRQTSGCSRRTPGGEPWSLLRESSGSRAGWSHPSGTRHLLPTREARAVPGTRGAGPAFRLPADPFRQGGTLLMKGQGGSPFSPRASALLRPTRDGV